jgi:hypothetical protein
MNSMLVRALPSQTAIANMPIKPARKLPTVNNPTPVKSPNGGTTSDESLFFVTSDAKDDMKLPPLVVALPDGPEVTDPVAVPN